MKRILICLLAFFAAFQPAAAQTSFHGDAAHTGIYQSPAPDRFKGVKWTFKTNGPILSSPAITGGVIFIGSEDHNLYAVNQKTGQQKWKFETKGSIASSPAVENGVVYFGSYDGGFYALDSQTGALKWKFEMQYERRFQAKGIHGNKPKEQIMPDIWDFFLSSPVVSNGRVYFGSGDGNVYALDSQTGVLKWKFATKDVVHASPAIVDNTVYIGSWDSYLYALNADTGQERWRFKTGEDPEAFNQVGFQSSPTVAGGVVYVGCRDSHVYAVDAATGQKKWEYSTEGAWVSTTPAVRDNNVFIGTGGNNQFHALDAKTGKSLFSFDTRSMIFSSAAVAGNLAYFGDLTGTFYAVNTKSGKSVWEFQTEGAKRDSLKLLSTDGKFNTASFTSTFFDFSDSYINMYRRFTVGSILSSPVIDSGEIYFGSTDGLLYALY